MSAKWKFADAPSTACFTTAFVLKGSPILRVYHDYDGDWQFHGAADQSSETEDAKLVCLADMVAQDSSLNKVHDLPFGWKAERSNPKDDWQYEKNNPFPSFAEHGFYLEDAVWLSQYLPDITPPKAKVRDNLQVDAFVKLVFRFAAEDSDREDNQCERMWVRVVGRDEDENYSATIENDPQHDSAKYGDLISFHPLHIADVETD